MNFCSFANQFGIVHRGREGDALRAACVRVAQVIREGLNAVGAEVIVVVEHDVFNRTTGTLETHQVHMRYRESRAQYL